MPEPAPERTPPDDTGPVECWNPGGPCPRPNDPACELCGTPPDDTTEGLRERVTEVIHATSMCEQGDPAACAGGCRDLADAVLAALAGVPGDLPARMAEAMRRALGSQLDHFPNAPEFLAAAAMSVRWEHAVSQAAEVERLRAELAEAKRENANWREITEIYNEASENWRKRAMPAEAERDALKAAIERARERLDWLIANGFGARTDTLSELRAALDATETPESGDWLKNLTDGSLAAAREKFGPAFAPETPGDAETEPRRDEYGHTPDCPSGSQFLGEDPSCRCAQTLAARTPGDAEEAATDE